MRQFTVRRCWWRALGGVAVALTLGALGLTEVQVVELTGNLRQDILDPASQTFLPRDKNRYRIPTKEDLDVWRQVMRAMLHGKLETAAKLVTPLAPSYKVIKFTDTVSTPARVYHLLLEGDLTAGTSCRARSQAGGYTPSIPRLCGTWPSLSLI